MGEPFDATTKQIVEVNPQDWLELIGLPRLPAHLVYADLSAVTTDADRVLKITELPERLFHFEFESGRDASQVPRRVHCYNTLVDSLYGLPAATVVFLLNPQAGRVSEVTGYFERSRPDTGHVAKFWSDRRLPFGWPALFRYNYAVALQRNFVHGRIIDLPSNSDAG